MIQDMFGIEKKPRKHQVTDYDTFLHQAVVIEDLLGTLSDHLRDRFFCHGKIVIRVGIFPAYIRGKELHVGKVDIDRARKRFDRFHGLIPAAVIKGRDRKTFFSCEADAFDNVRDEMRAGHEVDVVGAHFLKRQHGVGKVLRGIDFSGKRIGSGRGLPLLAADQIVLAEDTAEITARKEDGAGTGRSGKAGLFPHVKTDSRDMKLRRHGAETRLLPPVDPAGTRTEAAGRICILYAF